MKTNNIFGHHSSLMLIVLVKTTTFMTVLCFGEAFRAWQYRSLSYAELPRRGLTSVWILSDLLGVSLSKNLAGFF